MEQGPDVGGMTAAAPRHPGSSARLRAPLRLAREYRARYRQILAEENRRWQQAGGAS